VHCIRIPVTRFTRDPGMLLSSYRSVSRQTFPGNGCRVLHGPVRRYHPCFPTDAARSQWTRRSTPPPGRAPKTKAN